MKLYYYNLKIEHDLTAENINDAKDIINATIRQYGIDGFDSCEIEEIEECGKDEFEFSIHKFEE